MFWKKIKISKKNVFDLLLFLSKSKNITYLLRFLFLLIFKDNISELVKKDIECLAFLIIFYQVDLILII